MGGARGGVSATTETANGIILFVVAAGLLRNLGHKKKDRVRQDSTLIYTGGALTWHVSIIFRDRKPLPFSEDFSKHIECIMGVGPDMVAFLDYYTKVGLCVCVRALCMYVCACVCVYYDGV